MYPQFDRKPRIAFFGSHYWGAAVLGALMEMANYVDICLIATDDPRMSFVKPKRRIWKHGNDESLTKLVPDLADKLGLTPYQGDINTEEFWSMFCNSNPDAIVTCVFGQKLPQHMLGYVAGPAINIHLTAPGYELEHTQGALCLELASALGSEIDATAHRMSCEWDKGEVVARSKRYTLPSSITSQTARSEDVVTFWRQSAHIVANMIEDKFLDLLLSDLASSSGNVPKNWAGNISYGARFLFEPATISEVQDIVARMPSIKVVGTRHSFNQVADCPGGALVSLQKLTSSPELVTNTKSPTVTVSGETTYSELNNFLHERGLALRNLASLPHISVAGSIATATHGSGDRNRCLAADVVGLSIIKADGNLVTVSRESHGSDFDGMVVSLGALGVVVDVTLAVVPTYDVSQVVYDDVPMDIVVGNLDDLFAAGYSVSLFTLWQQNQFHQVWVKQVAGLDVLPEVLQGQSVATTGRHPIPGVTGESCTKQLNQAGPWHHRLPHFRPEFVPSHGNELQSEFLVPRQYAQDAIVTIMKLGAIVTPHLHVSEVRSIAADSLWMSPFYETPCIGIHFTWKNDWAKVEPILKKIELALGPHAARPHWGKLFATPIAQTAALYPRFAEFRDLVRSWDPCGKFANPFLKELLASESDNSH